MFKTVNLAKKPLLAALCVLPSYSVAASDFTLDVSGRVLFDYTNAKIDDPIGDISEARLRAGQLGIDGKYGSNLSYKFEISKTQGKSVTGIQDAFIEYKFSNSPFSVKGGQFKTPNSLDEQTSGRFVSALERAGFTDAFAFDRRLGISLNASGDRYTFVTGAFSSNLENNGQTENGYAFAARGTYLPIKTDETVVHMGGSWRYRNKGKNGDTFRYRQKPFASSVPDRIVSTNKFAKADNFIGAEAAMIHNNVWLAGEYGYTYAYSDTDGPDGKFNGFYGEAGMFFGGEKVYKGGRFNRPKVNRSVEEGGWGAVSFVARYDSLDLDYDTTPGKLKTLILGTDWWPTTHTRVGLDYFNADANTDPKKNGHGIVTRLQFDF